MNENYINHLYYKLWKREQAKHHKIITLNIYNGGSRSGKTTRELNEYLQYLYGDMIKKENPIKIFFKKLLRFS